MTQRSAIVRERFFADYVHFFNHVKMFRVGEASVPDCPEIFGISERFVWNYRSPQEAVSLAFHFWPKRTICKKWQRECGSEIKRFQIFRADPLQLIGRWRKYVPILKRYARDLHKDSPHRWMDPILLFLWNPYSRGLARQSHSPFLYLVISWGMSWWNPFLLMAQFAGYVIKKRFDFKSVAKQAFLLTWYCLSSESMFRGLHGIQSNHLL
jgi:hypothetical protein